MKAANRVTRRSILFSAAGLALAAGSEPIVDIHQHTSYSGRTDEQLIAHQSTMGVTTTILLPAGSQFGLAVGAGGNESVAALAKKHPGEFAYFANEVTDLRDAPNVVRSCLARGAIGIGEQKFSVAVDSPSMHELADVAAEFRVPVLLHFQHDTYNLGFERFYKVLEKHPTVAFIGHAQTWWANIDRGADPRVLYPKGKVTPGGLTDRYLSDYPNMYGDLSAGSGLNALLRDEEHARAFLARHADKLLFGSDCNDTAGQGAACSGSQCIAAIRRLAADRQRERKILHDNATRLLRLPRPPVAA